MKLCCKYGRPSPSSAARRLTAQVAGRSVGERQERGGGLLSRALKKNSAWEKEEGREERQENGEEGRERSLVAQLRTNGRTVALKKDDVSVLRALKFLTEGKRQTRELTQSRERMELPFFFYGNQH